MGRSPCVRLRVDPEWWKRVFAEEDTRQGSTVQFFGAVYRQLQCPSQDRSVELARALVRQFFSLYGPQPAESLFFRVPESVVGHSDPVEDAEFALMTAVRCFVAFGDDPAAVAKEGILACFRLHIASQGMPQGATSLFRDRAAVVVPFPTNAESPTLETK